MEIIENDKNGIFIEENKSSVVFYQGELTVDNFNYSSELTKKLYEKMKEYYE